jgi:integrase
MTFLTDVQRIKTGLIIFRRKDVKHANWYCRIKIPGEDRYKTISLKTSDVERAKDEAIDHAANVRARVENQLPVFDKTFADVALAYSAFQKETAEAGQITMHRWETIATQIRLHLIPYMGTEQIARIPHQKWERYTLWRKKEGGNLPPRKRSKRAVFLQQQEEVKNPPKRTPARDGTIRQELMTAIAIMNFAVSRNYIRESQVPNVDLPSNKDRREAFSLKEYRHLHTYARTKWIKKGANRSRIWYRQMTYNFILVMANTGMRPPEAKNLRWRDIDVRKDRQGRVVVVLNVSGKGKFGELVAPGNVATYFDRIRALFIEAQKWREPKKSEHEVGPKPDDFVFTTFEGQSAKTLYSFLIEDLLKETGLLTGNTGKRRSTYCFRHTYATFRLMEGVDVYWLAKQMRTSVKMIEDFYGHVTPTKNAERILQGMEGWGPQAIEPGDNAGSVNADGAGTEGRVLPKAGKASRSTRRRHGKS